MRIGELSSLVRRYQEAKDKGRLQDASEATMRAWIDELLSLFGWDVQNTQQVLTEHTLNKTERARLNEIGSTNTRPDYTLVNGGVSNYPQAYAYLQSCRDVLDARDKGEDDIHTDMAYVLAECGGAVSRQRPHSYIYIIIHVKKSYVLLTPGCRGRPRRGRGREHTVHPR